MNDSCGISMKITDLSGNKKSKQITSETKNFDKIDNFDKIVNNDIHELLIQGCTYFDILLYNCYDENKRIVDREKLSTAFDDLIDNYSNLFDFGISLSGYQFVGIILENNLSTTEATHIQVAYFILSVGFLISMFGVLLCFITIEYLRGCREENTEFIIAGINKYKTLFKLGDIILYADCLLFAIPINILIYNSLAPHFGMIYNVLCCILFALGTGFHYLVIISRQEYNISQDDIKRVDKFNTDIFKGVLKIFGCEQEFTYKRKLNDRGNYIKKD